MEQVSSRFIPSEIIEVILLRSPAKSLSRFKSVSKTWNSLISDPRFIKTHTHQLHQFTKKLLVFSFKDSSLYLIDLTIDNMHGIPATAKRITIGSLPPVRWKGLMGLCNGLVLAIDVDDAMFLMNPATHDLWKLPVNPLVYRTDMYIACYGFGYDSSTDDYKVVCIPALPYGSVSIYSLRNNSWRKVPNTPHERVNRGGSCVPVNGNAHWYTNYSSSIIAFSFVDELFSEIKPPDSFQNKKLWCYVVEIGGRLGVYYRLMSGDYELCVMQEYGDSKSWTRVFSHGDYKWPLCLLQGSDRDIVFIDEVGVGLLNIDEGRRRNVRILSGPSEFNYTGGAFDESIESPNRVLTKVMEQVTGRNTSTKALSSTTLEVPLMKRVKNVLVNWYQKGLSKYLSLVE